MLSISQRQMSIFRDVQIRHFQDEVIDHLRQSFGPSIEARRLDDARLRSLIDQTIERAGQHGVSGEYDVVRFIEFVFEYGDHFDSLPWAATVLNASDLTGGEKMDRLDAVSVFALR